METIVDTLYQRLRQDIVECELTPGKSLSEAELGRLYHASRTPVREACRRLEHEGLMRITPFRGYAVAPLSVTEFKDLEEMQLIFEPEAAALAADRASPQEIGAMRDLGGYVYQVGDKVSYREFIRSNYELHVLIAQSTRNSRLIDTVGNIHVRLMRFFYLGLAFEAHGATLAAEHMRLVEAIAARDAKAARRRAAEHTSKAIARSSTMLMDAIRFGESVFEAAPEGKRAAVRIGPKLP
jgi:GntR family transcriptional regulator, rspAB operon transcriptional repressor